MDPELVYVTRSFCILEAYAACACNETKLLCHVEGGDAESVKEKFEDKSISSEHAQTRDEKDKRLIDDMIVNGTYLYDPISFKEMNAKLTEELHGALIHAASAELVNGPHAETVTIRMPETAAV